MIITEPLPAGCGSRSAGGAETLLDGSHLYTYSQRTGDGRIAIGGRGVPYRFGSRTDREGPAPPGTVTELCGAAATPSSPACPGSAIRRAPGSPSRCASPAPVASTCCTGASSRRPAPVARRPLAALADRVAGR